MDCAFKGVKFFSTKAGIEGGRNLDTKKIPFSDKTKTLDLGTREKIIPLSGFVVGFDHRKLALDLIGALDKEGPGDLTHPTVGNIRVYVQSWTCTEEDDAQGITKFSFHFVQDSELIIESAPTPDADNLTTGADAINDAAESNFLDNFMLLDMAVDGLERLEKGLQAAIDGIMPAIDFIEDQTKNITRLAFGIRQMREKIKELINLPKKLFNRFKDAFNNLWGAINNQSFGDSVDGNNTSVLEAVEASFQSSDFSFNPDPVADLSTQHRLNETVELVRDTINLLILAQTTANLPVILNENTPVSGDEIHEINILIVDVMNRILETTQSPDIFRSVLNQRAAVSGYFRGLTGRLSPVVLNQVTPAIVLAYNLSGSDSLSELQDIEAELITRNKIIHPGFVPAAESIEVLNG